MRTWSLILSVAGNTERRVTKMSMWEGCECLIEACPKNVYSRWLCANHYALMYSKFWQKGRKTISRSVSSLERFAEKITVTPSCWLWTGSKIYSGYGSFGSVDFSTTLAHRVSYEMFCGTIPPTLEIDHKFVKYGCPRHCVNPEHLRLATRTENNRNRRSQK